MDNFNILNNYHYLIFTQNKTYNLREACILYLSLSAQITKNKL